jgi:hypothetical protein
MLRRRSGSGLVNVSRAAALLRFLAFGSTPARAEDEIALFDERGKASAYIVLMIN